MLRRVGGQQRPRWIVRIDPVRSADKPLKVFVLRLENLSWSASAAFMSA